MICATTTLLFCALSLCGLQDAAASLRGRCVGGLCYWQDPVNFQSADKVCKEKGSQLFEPLTEGDMKALRSLLTDDGGRFWLRGSSQANPRNCAAASVTRGQDVTLGSKPCREALDGFVCQFKSNDMCGSLQEGRSKRVTYVFADFQVVGSETFPQGTVATVGQEGAEYPVSTHLCFSNKWLRAPWLCEVMNGGCERSCDRSTNACECPAGSTVHANNVSCVADSCARCEQDCQRLETGPVCTCKSGYRLGQDGATCVDVNECEERDPCTNEGEECVNRRGTYECMCMDGFDEEDGVCVNVTICSFCEHKCAKVGGVYQCACKDGFRVSPIDSTKCVRHCTERDCPAQCHANPEWEKKGMQQCYCPDGYIADIRNQSAICTDINECEHQDMCDHDCENLYGSYRCSCREGYQLQGPDKCVPLEDEDYEPGSGTSTVRATPASSRPATFPSYVKTGSALGITAFVAVCAVLLACLVRGMLRRCSTVQLHSFKHRDIDIFTLQQVTTEQYKRFSFDKKDSQRQSTLLET